MRGPIYSHIYSYFFHHFSHLWAPTEARSEILHFPSSMSYSYQISIAYNRLFLSTFDIFSIILFFLSNNIRSKVDRSRLLSHLNCEPNQWTKCEPNSEPIMNIMNLNNESIMSLSNLNSESKMNLKWIIMNLNSEPIVNLIMN